MSSARQSTGWELRRRQILLPKSGFELSECEDFIGVDEQNGRFAVADGATEAFDARGWAQRLAHNWVQSDAALTPDAFNDWIAAEGLALHASWNQLKLPWYAEEKARNGSFAAFVGVEFDLDAEVPSWRAIALGDSCLFHCRGGSLLKSLPLSDAASFNSAPLLVPSDPALYRSSAHALVLDSGACQHDDVLFLLSDAVAAWYLEHPEQSDLSGVFESNDDDAIAAFFDNERQAGRIKNDDIAVIRIEVQQRSIN